VEAAGEVAVATRPCLDPGSLGPGQGVVTRRPG
jgi:hypothetical protein